MVQGIDLSNILKDIFTNLNTRKDTFHSLSKNFKLNFKIKDLDKLIIELKKQSIKNIKLAVSAPFHCSLMHPATKIMDKQLNSIKFAIPNNMIVSNVTAEPSNDPDKIKNLLIEQIEKPVRWRESILNMVNLGCNKFIEIGPGKVLSGLVKRIDRNVKIIQINNLEDLQNL